MTDLEMTKLCAEAMGYAIEHTMPDGVGGRYIVCNGEWFTPLSNDAQAMALVKKLDLSIIRPRPSILEKWWTVERWTGGEYGEESFRTSGADLNRSIIECVAKMQSAKVPA